MKKSTKTALLAFLLLIAAAIPLYYLTRPSITQPADTLQIKGNVNNPIALTTIDLQALPSVTKQMTISSSGHPEYDGTFNYTGVLLKDLLNQAQANANASSVYIQASDGYGTTITIQDAQNPDTFIAYQKNGQPLTLLKDGGEGPLRLILGGDQYAQRWVRGIVAINVS